MPNSSKSKVDKVIIETTSNIKEKNNMNCMFSELINETLKVLDVQKKTNKKYENLINSKH